MPIASTAIYPLALYSNAYTAVADIPAGAQIAVPNDETNKSRAIHLLAENGLLTLKEGTGIIAAEEDIDAAASKVTVAPMDAQQTVTALPSIAGAVVNNDFVNDAGLDPEKALAEDDPSDASAQPYINVFVVRAADADNERLLQLAGIFHDADFEAALKEQSADSAVIVNDTPSSSSRSSPTSPRRSRADRTPRWLNPSLRSTACTRSSGAPEGRARRR